VFALAEESIDSGRALGKLDNWLPSGTKGREVKNAQRLGLEPSVNATETLVPKGHRMIRLKKNADRRVRKGHLWVFSNEIGDPPWATWNPAVSTSSPTIKANPRHDLRQPEELDCRPHPHTQEDSHRRGLREGPHRVGLERRKRLFPTRETYRIVFSDSDLLPGLIVDRYGTFLAVQSLTAGMIGSPTL